MIEKQTIIDHVLIVGGHVVPMTRAAVTSAELALHSGRRVTIPGDEILHPGKLRSMTPRQ